MSDAVTPWLHILAVTVWVGPQFFLFIAALPAIRTIEDRQARARVMRVIVTRFGWLAWAAMAVIVLTGISNLFQVGGDKGQRLLQFRVPLPCWTDREIEQLVCRLTHVAFKDNATQCH